MKNDKKWQVLDTWNGGKKGTPTVRFTSTEVGAAGHNECFAWFHKNTSFSFSEATTNQGYRVVQLDD